MTLTAGQRALLEASLQQRQQQINRQLAERLAGGSRAEHASELLQQDADDLSRHAEEREVDHARSDLQMQELGHVSEALRRLHEPGYGACAECEAPIPFDRLKVEPWALRCVACESAHETGTRA